MSVSELDRLTRKLNRLGDENFVMGKLLESLKRCEKFMAELNREQLEQSTTAEGQPTPIYRGDWGKRKGKARWDLHYKGDFYKSIKFKVVGQELIIDYDEERLESLLRLAAGEYEFIGLTDENLIRVRDECLGRHFVDAMVKYITT